MNNEVDLVNARDPEQLRKMQEYSQNGECHFCKDGYFNRYDLEKKQQSPIIHENDHWFVVENDYPYAGSTQHFLVVTKKHIQKMTELEQSEQLSFFEIMRWMERHSESAGYSLFIRNGDTRYTGGTLNHLHAHFLVGIQKPEKTNFPENHILVTLGYKE